MQQLSQRVPGATMSVLRSPVFTRATATVGLGFASRQLSMLAHQKASTLTATKTLTPKRQQLLQQYQQQTIIPQPLIFNVRMLSTIRNSANPGSFILRNESDDKPTVSAALFPDMLPSTYEDKATAEKKREKMQKVRNEMSRYLKETIAEMRSNTDRAGIQQKDLKDTEDSTIEDTSEFLAKIRSSGESVSTADLLRVANIFEDELTLDNLSRPQLVSICRFMGVNAFGTDNYLRYQITNRMRYIRADDKVISQEGIDTLSVPELQSACQSRGIRTVGVSPARMRDELSQWIELHVEHNIPSTLLILSRIIAAGEPLVQNQDHQQFNADALQATINSLPDNLVNEATLRLAEVSGKATPKQKLDVLEEQEELIEDEEEQESKKKKSEAAAAEKEASATKTLDAPTEEHKK
ncbi:LETM1 domain-containing protein ylh47 [Coemansia sp. Benny D115]|nr:LETM1 domain-containing protein ylh47 [Coemansia sp. Benny D115]